MGVLYNDTSTRRTFYISRIIDEEMKKGDLFVITGMSGAELVQIMLKRNASSATAELLFHF